MKSSFRYSLTRLVRFLSLEDKRILVPTAIFAIATFACDIALPWFLKDILSVLLASRTLTLPALLPAIGIMVLRTLFSLVHGRLNASLANAIVSALNRKMAFSCINTPLASTASSSERISLFTEALITIEQFIDSVLWQTWTQTLYCIFAALIVIYLGGTTVLLGFIPFLIGIFCSYLLREKIGKEINLLFTKRAKTGELFQDFLEGKEVLYTYQARPRAFSLFNDLEDYASPQRRKAYVLLALYPALFEAIGFLGIIAVLGVGYLLLKRSPESGSGTASILYLAFLARSLFAVSPLLPLWSRFKVAVDSLEKIFNSVPILPLISNLPTQEIFSEARTVSISQLTFSYPSGEKVFDNFSGSFSAGVTTALIGPNGVGKSTLLKLVLKEIQPHSGMILCGNAEISLQKTAYLPQEPYLFRMSILDNLRLACPDVTETEIWQMAEELGLQEFLKTRTLELHSFVGERGNMLSGGERQKISLLRFALRAKDSLLCLLDEPTSYVDVQSENTLMKILFQLCAGKTTVIVSHRPWVIEQCKNTLLLGKEIL